MGYELDAALGALKERVRKLELSVARSKPAAGVTYSNTGSGMTATDSQAAIDELQAAIDALGPSGGLPWFVVTDPAYGATNDGTTDDTTAINDAIAALNAAGSGVLYFPAGTGYKVTAALTTITASGLVLGDGAGAWSSTASAPIGTSSVINCTSGTAVLFTVTGLVQFRGLSMVKTGSAPSAGAAIQVSGSDYRQRVTYDSLLIAGFYIGIDHRVNSIFTMVNVAIWNPVLYGVKVQNTVETDAGGFTIMGCTIISESQGATAGIYIASSGGNKILGTNINNIGTYGVQLVATADSSILLIVGCSIENYTGDAIHLDAGGVAYSLVSVTGCEFGQYGNATGRAVYTTGVNDVIIDDYVLVADTGTPTAFSLNSGTRGFIGKGTTQGFGTVLASSSFTSLQDGTGSIGAGVLITGTPTAGQVPVASSGTAAAWDDLATVPEALDDLTDVTITSAGTGEELRWNGSAWVNDTGMICVAPGAITVDDGTPFGITLTTVWGIDAGVPYYDDANAADGEEAALFYDPLTDNYTVVAYDF